VQWVPLVDATEEAGGLVVIPQSHRWGLQAGQRDELSNMRSDAEPEQRAPAVSVPTRVGDVVLFSNLTFHGSGLNRTDGVRWSLDWRVHASPKSARIASAPERERRTTEWWASRAWWSHPGGGDAAEIAPPLEAWLMPQPRL
jgi:ectoine hydroxylase-related dioxygenase (phytanoyl-CoA dioxygenase family)